MPKDMPYPSQHASRPRANNNLPADRYQGRFPPLNPLHSLGLSYDSVRIEFGDTLVLTRAMRKHRTDWRYKTAVLNCASDEELAGGWKHRAGPSQEDALCYSSTLFPTLEKWKHMYTWRNHCLPRTQGNEAECADIYSPNVCIFKDDLANGCKDLKRKDMDFVSVVSVAGLACPPTVVTREGKTVMKSLRNKSKMTVRNRMVLRMAA